jgi:hypothetical protein
VHPAVRVEVAGEGGRITLVGDSVAEQPAGAAVTVNRTVPVKPFRAETVIVEVPVPGGT